VRLLPVVPALLLLVAAGLALVARLGNTVLRIVAAASCALGGLAIVFQWRAGRVGGSGTFDGDPLSLFLGGVVLVAIGFAVLLRRESATATGRLLATGALSIVAVSTRELLFALPAIVLGLVAARDERLDSRRLIAPAIVGASLLAALALLYRACGATDLAGIAAAESSGQVGLDLLVMSLYAAWFFENRRSVRLSKASLVTRTASSFLQLVAVVSVLLRLTAWLPEAAPGGFVGTIAVASLAIGALGMLGATRVTTFATALFVARAGVVLVALLGGVHGRAGLLVELAVTGVALLLVAFAVDGLFAVDEISQRLPLPSRLALLTGALAAAAFPPLPGFVATFPLVSALLSANRIVPVAVLCGCLFLIGLGSMRLAARAFGPGELVESPPSKQKREAGALVAVAAALAAIGWLGIAPGGFWEIAARAALGVF
jgi:hypothetical protein